MAKQKKITRKQLLKEPDEFITFTGRLINFGRRYKRQLIYGACGVLVLLVAVTLTRTISNLNESRAQARFFELQKRYQSALAEKGAEAAYRAVKAEFEAAIDRYSGKDATRVNRFIYGNICYAGGDYGNAIDFYRQALADFDDLPFYRRLARGKIGYARMAQSDTAAAIAAFESIVSQPESFQADSALFQLGLLYESAGEGEKSRSAFKRILTDHPNSVYKSLVEEKLG